MNIEGQIPRGGIWSSVVVALAPVSTTRDAALASIDGVLGRSSPEEAWRLEQAAAALREIALLSGGGTSAGAIASSPPPAVDPSGWKTEAKAFAADQEQLRADRRSNSHRKWEWGARVFFAEAYAEHKEQFDRALERAGQPDWVIGRRGWEGVKELIETIPTLHAIAEFRRQRHNGSQTKFGPSDALDQLGLPAPMVYCDIVVTEKQHAANLGKLAERHGTVLLYRLEDLPKHLF